jgi:hypothetical protein
VMLWAPRGEPQPARNQEYGGVCSLR